MKNSRYTKDSNQSLDLNFLVYFFEVNQLYNIVRTLVIILCEALIDDLVLAPVVYYLNFFRTDFFTRQ